ncbi:multidrug ABC transporter ATP-binding protein [Ktedonobacter sp. SOSP1-85]|uniref:ABC transporter ATP-binding protein n=1 Tax=Ktedonobacter sp. SOSP1-85 TaxID=2778367 RepID=UPI001916167E|nr:ABC transporter ATP-binding protein [Ktedonobacter sp. SOSP1-85]GHO76805.1 multidrug ABC transporter ATP-binding protein [Ktedonobacter sp. SOSP1-85]
MRIEVRHLTKVYGGGIHALEDLNLTIPGGMFGLLGPNGAGKTTLMRILAGVLSPSEGSIRVGSYDGATERGRTQIQRILGYLPQELGVYTDLSAYEFLDYMGILKGLNDGKQRRRRVDELLETVALSHLAHRKLKTFSGGMKRRVGIAQALLNDPQLLIVDEPTAGLDPEERILFRNLLSDLAGKRTVLLSTHIVEDIAQTCQQLVLMANGHMLFQGTVSDMLKETRGKVWQITTAGQKPAGNFTVVSTLNMGLNTQYRVVGEYPSYSNVVAIDPNLEDSYVWFMRNARQTLAPTISPLDK